MIVFIAPNPHKIKEQEGFLRRVSAIDELFIDEKKVYFDDLQSNDVKARMLADAKMIYVHSIYQAEKIIDYYPYLAEKIILDLHGVVPEELSYSGNNVLSTQMERIEKIAFEKGSNFVAVSNAMVGYYKKKYNSFGKKNWIILPIFDLIPAKTNNIQKKMKIIYAGGSQKWQNVELMVETINRTYQKFQYTILTHNPDAFRGISESASKKTTIKAVKSDDVAMYYKDASMGFILRDNILINNVSCPTKLVEYLGNGIVPIVLSPDIGDFKELGFEYLKADELDKENISEEVLTEKQKANFEVLHKLQSIADKGRTSLLGLSEKFSATYSDNQIEKIKIAIKAILDVRELREKVRLQEEEIRHLTEVTIENNKTIEHYHSTLEGIINSKRWKAAQIISAASNLRPKRNRKS